METKHSPTFLRKLGDVTYRHGDVLYKVRISDSGLLVDDFHARQFFNSLGWLDYLQTRYPLSKTSPVTLTSHEFMKRLEQNVGHKKNHSEMEDDSHDSDDEEFVWHRLRSVSPLEEIDEDVDHFAMDDLLNSIRFPVSLQKLTNMNKNFY